MYFIEQFMNFKFYLLGLYPKGAISGLVINLILVLIAISISFFLGLVFGYSRLSKTSLIRYPIGWFVDLFRSTPLVLIMFWFYFFIPSFGIRLSPFSSVAIGLCAYASAVQAEIVRAGILAVPKGQMEAAITLGLSKFGAMRHIILPQAFRIMIPSFTSFYTSLFKDTSVAYTIGVVELLRSAVVISERLPNRIFAAYAMVMIGFWVISFSMSRAGVALEKRIDGRYAGDIKLLTQ